MAKKKYEEANILAIANAIREKTGTNTTYTTAEMPSGLDEVYDAGKKAEYDARWNAIHESIRDWGAANAFSGATWTKDTFRPTQSMIDVDSAYMMFRDSRIEIDLPALLNELGVQITFAQGIAMQYTFYGTKFTRLGVLDFSDRGYTNGCFSYSDKLVTIDKIICNRNTKFTDSFDDLSSLENILFEGELATDGLNLRGSKKLSKASIASVVNVLSTATSGLTVTLSKAAVDEAFEETADDGHTSAEWLALVATRSNWNIALA